MAILRILVISGIFFILGNVGVSHGQVCDNSSYVLIEEPRRSTMAVYNNTVNTALCDNDLDEALWYRFFSYAGETIVERAENNPVPIYHCGTEAPMYIRGLNSHPTVDSSTVNATVCAHWGGNPCNWIYTIQIHRCPAQGNQSVYFVYKLEATLCNLAYCVGDYPPCNQGDYWNGFSCVKDPCNVSTGLTTLSSFVSSAVTDDPCTTTNTRAETTVVPTTTPTATAVPTTTMPPHDPCSPSPCRNGATCTDDGTTHTCTCAPGFTEHNCDVEINECVSNPCYPFGKCTDLVGDYNCSCNSGYEQSDTRTCKETDFCANETQLCFNGGTCMNQNELGRYYCICPDLEGKKQFVGLHCETELELITEPTVTKGGISPASGIIAGGANVTIRGQGMNLFEPLGAYLVDKTSTPNPKQSLYAFVAPNLTRSDSITVRIPPADDGYINLNMLMIVEYTGPINVTSEEENLRFKYSGNPVITTIEPKDILVSGGVHLTVSGSNMNTVQNPMMDVTTFVVNQTNGPPEQNFSREICSLLSTSAISCLVPQGIVPPEFINTTASVGESIRGVVHLESSFRHSRGGRTKRAPVANLTHGDGSTFQMYLGFVFDEYPTYSNISKSLPNVTLNLVTPQVSFDVEYSTDFVSNKKDTISLYGSGLTFGCSLGDYSVLISDEPCTVTSLTDNELQCRPPKDEPTKSDNSGRCSSGLHPVMVYVGGNSYLGGCLSYTTDYTDLIIGVTVICVVVVAIIILVTVLLYKRHRKRQERDNAARDAMQRKKEFPLTDNDYDDIMVSGNDADSTSDKDVNPGQPTTFAKRSDPTSTSYATSDYLVSIDNSTDTRGAISDDVNGDIGDRTLDRRTPVSVGMVELRVEMHGGGSRPLSEPPTDYDA